MAIGLPPLDNFFSPLPGLENAEDRTLKKQILTFPACLVYLPEE
jgi:hypothetical protein